MPVSSTIGPSGSGGEGQLMPGGAVGARPGPRPALAGAGCCASTAIPVSTSVKANTPTRIESFSLNVGSHYMPDCYTGAAWQPGCIHTGMKPLICFILALTSLTAGTRTPGFGNQ